MSRTSKDSMDFAIKKTQEMCCPKNSKGHIRAVWWWCIMQFCWPPPIQLASFLKRICIYLYRFLSISWIKLHLWPVAESSDVGEHTGVGKNIFVAKVLCTLFAWVYQSTWVPKITKSAIATTVQRWFQGSTGPTGTKGNHRNVSFDCQRIHFVQLALHNLFSRKGCFDLFSSIVGLCLVMMMH